MKAFWWRLASVVGALLMASSPVHAHKGSDAYLDVQEQSAATSVPGASPTTQIEYRFSLAVAIKDLDLLLPIDANADGKVTWGELKAALPSVLALANESANIEPQAGQGQGGAQADAGSCHLSWESAGVDQRSDGNYVRMEARARCSAAQALVFRYTLLKDQDANHRLLVAGRIAGKDLLTTTSPLQPSLVLRAALGAAVTGGVAAANTQAPSNAWLALRDYFSLGVHHLLQGYDHLAFLLALVLPLRLVLFGAARANPSAPETPAVLNRQAQALGRRHVPEHVWWELLRTITAFTIGHSITLVLATLGFTEASPRWVEPAIALTIMVTALLNLRPLPWVRTDVLALLFGMVHGYGFAGLLLEAAAPSGLLPWALGGFNLGVEAGQLIAVGAWVLVSQPLVVRRWYPSVVVRLGSVVLALLALWWFWQRVR
jgi:hypothetical protein